jgi:hypothetical protein
MTDFELQLANYFFYAFHTVLIIFNLFGWIPARTRKLNLLTLLTTFVSWIILGFWKGWGYCFLTDWHYSVLRKLGEKDMPRSYIAFLVEKISGWLPNEELINGLTLGLSLLALAFSIRMNRKQSSQ